MKSVRLITLLLTLLVTPLFAQTSAQFNDNWPTWRGPIYTGVAPNSNPPVSWSETENVKWKTSIPGKGYSTPVIWGNQVFVTTAIATGKIDPADSSLVSYKFDIIAVSRSDGKIIWEQTVAEEAVPDRIHQGSSHASNSAITDGENLYAYFGSRGLFCFDFSGKLLWKRDFGQQQKRNNFGEGDSPAIFGDKIVVLWDHEGESAIYCLDKYTGKELWKKDRDEGSSWSTPLILEYDGKVQVITAASNRVRSYDLANGDIIWECSGLTGNVIPSPVFANGTLYVMSGYRGNALLAIRMAGASGNITGTDAIIWSARVNTPYAPSPILLNNRLYILRQNSGVLSCLNAADGAVYYGGEMLDNLGIVYNSPVAAGGRIYVLGGTGLTYVIKEGSELNILSKNKLDDSFTASPAIAGDEIFLRGLNFLYCLEVR